ncbi:MAG: sigma 54-interacting transcriptional regulator [Planctomycetota bacterium]
MQSAPHAHLHVVDPVAGESVVRLGPGTLITLGRAPTNDIVLHDERASRVHAEIRAGDGGWIIRDLQSRNGTTVNAEPVTGDRPLAPGDTVSIGMVRVSFGTGDPPTGVGTAIVTNTGTIAGDMPADAAAWKASITHRRARSSLLDDISQSAGSVPRVGRAAAELCRLAFALASASAASAIARRALDSVLEGTAATRGLVLLATRPGDAAHDLLTAETLMLTASTPDPWPAPLPVGVAATVLATNEAALAAGGTKANEPAATLAAPIRCAGRPVGVMHLEVESGGGDATPDDLEFVMAVCDAVGVAIENLTAREALSTRLANAADENERLRRRLGEETCMVGASPALQGILGQMQRVAATKATVLVRGESGAGKELIARAIHESSDRHAGAFVCLNCAALSETLLESELFGHEKGAFTGATERKIGKFEAAHRGTLMLDEIGEMSPAIQAKFLRVLEGHPFERVGGSGRVQVDVRVVAATNRDLEKAVAAGGFRRDLYFRLKVVEILVPPLRRRVDDIEPLAEHFLGRFAAETGRKIRGFTPAALEAMRAYQWPGNIRELRNVVERAVVLSQEEWIDVQDVSLSHLAVPGDTDKSGVARSGPFVPMTIEEVERRHVLATLEAVGANKTKAAAILGIERSTLDRKLAKWARA